MNEHDATAAFLDEVRITVVAGVAAGAVVVGVGSRLAMLALRLTSPSRVRGVTSDDGFTIGEVTVAGTYNLLAIGASVGVIAAFAYLMVAPRLIGPSWFRRSTTAVAAGAVVGSMLIHSDGVDFTLLEPTWFAIALFVALPATFGAVIGAAVDMVARPESWSARGRRRIVVPVLLTVLFPFSLLVLPFVLVGLLARALFRQSTQVHRLRSSPAFGVVVRLLWLTAAAAGLVALVADVRSIA